MESSRMPVCENVVSVCVCVQVYMCVHAYVYSNWGAHVKTVEHDDIHTHIQNRIYLLACV